MWRRRLRLLVCVLGSCALSGCEKYQPGTSAVAFMERNQERIGKNLWLGATKNEVSKLLPPPANRDATNVWLWIDVLPATNQTWRSLCSAQSGFFIVFTNDRLATKVYSNVTFSPAQALAATSGISESEGEALLQH